MFTCTIQCTQVKTKPSEDLTVNCIAQMYGFCWCVSRRMIHFKYIIFILTSSSAFYYVCTLYVSTVHIIYYTKSHVYASVCIKSRRVFTTEEFLPIFSGNIRCVFFLNIFFFYIHTVPRYKYAINAYIILNMFYYEFLNCYFYGAYRRTSYFFFFFFIASNTRRSTNC